MNVILFDQMPENHLIPSSDFRCDHIRKVLRLTEGDRLSIGLVNGPMGDAVITSIDSTGVSFSWTQTVPAADAVGLYPVTLLVAQVRPICMKRILREAVSLGVRRLVVTGTDTAEKSYQVSGLWKNGEYRKYLLDGAMQSARTGMSELCFADTVDDAVSQLSGDRDIRLMLDNVLDGVPLSSLAAPAGEVVLAVGPERGWSDRERALLLQAGYRPVSLGARVLRTETACSAGVAVLLGRMGLL
jgi:RsmE family RNA methyltransferase